MKRNLIETFLGAIVLVVAALFLAYGAKTGKVGGTASGYPVYAEFTEIGGLKTGDDVRISGVKAGTVGRIELKPGSFLASVELELDPSVQLPRDTASRISSESLLGGTFLALDPGGDEEMLKSGDRIQYNQDAQNLERLLGQFIFSLQDAKSDGGETATP